MMREEQTPLSKKEKLRIAREKAKKSMMKSPTTTNSASKSNYNPPYKATPTKSKTSSSNPALLYRQQKQRMQQQIGVPASPIVLDNDYQDGNGYTTQHENNKPSDTILLRIHKTDLHQYLADSLKRGSSERLSFIYDDDDHNDNSSYHGAINGDNDLAKVVKSSNSDEKNQTSFEQNKKGKEFAPAPAAPVARKSYFTIFYLLRVIALLSIFCICATLSFFYIVDNMLESKKMNTKIEDMEVKLENMMNEQEKRFQMIMTMLSQQQQVVKHEGGGGRHELTQVDKILSHFDVDQDFILKETVAPIAKQHQRLLLGEEKEENDLDITTKVVMQKLYDTMERQTTIEREILTQLKQQVEILTDQLHQHILYHTENSD